MAPVISSIGQTRSRLPTKWMQTADATATTTIKYVDGHRSPSESPLRWSTHTLAADPHDTVRSRADSTASTFVDTFAHRRKNRISDLTFVDDLDEAALTHLPQSDSLTSGFNDASLTLNNDDDDDDHESSDPTQLTSYKASLTHNTNHTTRYPHARPSAALDDDDDDDGLEHDDMAQRIDRLMAATMEALEASNRLVLDTLSSRAKLAQLNAIEAALDSHLDAREAHLKRQIQAVTDMTDFVAKTSAELQKLTGASSGARAPSGVASTSQRSSLAEPAELQVRDAAATGIVQALDRDATIGKTAAKRLERMLQTPSPSASPTSAAHAPQRKSNNANRRAFSISNLGSIQSSIAEEAPLEAQGGPGMPDPAQDVFSTLSDSRTSTPQKKRSVSYDSRAPSAIKLMGKLSAPTIASTSGAVSSASVLPSATAAVVSSIASVAGSSDSNGAKGGTTTRPSLMATLRQDSTSTSPSRSSRDDSTARPQTRGTLGLTSYSGSARSKASASVGVASTSVESTLAALLGMPSAAASESSRTETPSESSYFDSAVEDSICSASPPTPGSMHAIHGVLATPWKPATHEGKPDSVDVHPSSQQRSARRASVYANMVSPRASLSLSDRDRAQQLSSQLAELASERATWNPQSAGSANFGMAGSSATGVGSGGGGALRALQKLNQMSAAKIAGQGGASAEQQTGSKRVSLGLGLPSFSALRPSASRSTSTTQAPSEAPTAPACADVSAALSPPAQAPSSAVVADAPAKTSSNLIAADDQASTDPDQNATAADIPSSSLLGGGWRSWTSWNTAPAAPVRGETSASHN
ncbi:hypothetical protein EX895_002640 [Sporisorium graminicola]|uniref:Uncharacterized protein n=1 Tax=Sporisorium graminicola TaxID=280036 RepID=A0A4U7KY00_9BASI|nr:hypothetical protein EX895_002640 [Sporisorium graminicola]TKY88288.1 hypothetical protein EX895_002640 [Sporisorium graminicola]